MNGKKITAIGLATFLAVGGHKIVRGGNLGLAETLGAMDDNLTVAEDVILEGNLENEEAEVEAGAASFFTDDTYQALDAQAVEGAEVEFPDINVVLTFMQKVPQATAWQINGQTMYLAYNTLSNKKGEILGLDSVSMFHVDKENEIHRGLQLFLNDKGGPKYTIYTRDTSVPFEEGFVERVILAEQHADAEQQLLAGDFVAFDESFRLAKNGTRKDVGIFDGDLLSSLLELGAGKGAKDNDYGLEFLKAAKTSHIWQFGDAVFEIDFVKDKKVLKPGSVVSLSMAEEVDGVTQKFGLMRSCDPKDPSGRIEYALFTSMPVGKKTEVNKTPVTADQFADFYQSFVSEPTKQNFDSMLEQVQKDATTSSIRHLGPTMTAVQRARSGLEPLERIIPAPAPQKSIGAKA